MLRFGLRVWIETVSGDMIECVFLLQLGHMRCSRDGCFCKMSVGFLVRYEGFEFCLSYVEEKRHTRGILGSWLGVHLIHSLHMQHL